MIEIGLLRPEATSLLHDACTQLRRVDRKILSAKTNLERAQERLDAAQLERGDVRAQLIAAVREARDQKVPWNHIQEITGRSRQYLDRLLREAP